MAADQHAPMVAELARLLKRGGKLLLIDSNNPDNPDVLPRLKALYARHEGAGGQYLTWRRDFIADYEPEAPADDLALATCYMTRDQVAAAIERWKMTGGKMPESFFESGSMRTPVSMGFAVPSSPTDPQFFLAEFGKHGVACKASWSYPVGDGMTREQLAAAGSFYITGRKAKGWFGF
jgi:hypothetical protein